MTSKTHTIRPAIAVDRKQWDPLWQGYLQFYESTLSAEVTDTLWQRILDPAEPIEARMAVAENGELLGFTHFFPHPHTWYTAPVCYLNDLFVSPVIRGGGIGLALIAAVVEVAKQEGWAEVYWHTQQHNSVARGLYDKMTGGTDGFVNYSIRLEPGAA